MSLNHIVKNGDQPPLPITCETLQMINGASAGYVMVSDASGNATWTPLSAEGVVTVISTDASINITGTPSIPSLATGRLDQIASLHPATSAITANSQKITNLANGTASTDAVAYGQIVPALTHAIQATPSGPSGFSSTTPTMSGYAITYTPTGKSGLIQALFNATMQNTGTSTYLRFNMRYGTGTPPIAGATGSPGTLLGTAVTQSSNTNEYNGMGLQGLASSLTSGTTYWIDLEMATGDVGSSFSLFTPIVIVSEQP